MLESKPKSKLVETLKAQMPTWVIDRLEEIGKNGIPDLAVTGLGVTTWWEIKLARMTAPGLGFKSRDIQHLKMSRLDKHGYARYIIYEADGTAARQVRIVAPRELRAWRTSGHAVAGFNHTWVAAFIQEVHKLRSMHTEINEE